MPIVESEDILDSTENETTDSTAESTPQESQPDKTTTLPEKYRDKSVEEIIRMHQEAETLIGRQAQEVGEVRKLADQLIQRQFNTDTPKKEPEAELQDVDFFVDPKAAVNKLVNEHPAVKQAQQSIAQSKVEQVRTKILQKHPDAGTVAKDPAFLEWVKGNNARIAMFQAADSGLDYDSADELISNYKLYKGIKQEVVTEGATALRQESDASLKAASVPASQSTGQTGKKIFRRADLIRLQMTDPDRYIALQDEIMQAYREGRVK